ncbi:MAG: hypothetical protein RJB12_906, partial [Pseudomonadota bacterium]
QRAHRPVQSVTERADGHDRPEVSG